MDSEGFSAQTVYDSMHGRLKDLMPVSLLLNELKWNPLQVPLDMSSGIRFDLLKLYFYLDSMPSQKLRSDLPIDVTPLIDLCNKYRKKIIPGDAWSYNFYYLELLCQEGKLKPLFWGRVFDCLLTLGRLHGAGRIHEHNDESKKGRQELLQPWLNCGEQLIKNKMIIPPIIGPWLAQLAYEEPEDQNGDMQWDEGSGCDEMFSYNLSWKYEPFYDARIFFDILWDNMIQELWVSSIFCPRPICAHERRKWNKHAKRFAVSYRKCSDQQERKAKFVQYVTDNHNKEAIVSIAKQACESGLWPFGTPRKHKPGYDPLEACRQAVYRAVRRLNKPHSKKSD